MVHGSISSHFTIHGRTNSKIMFHTIMFHTIILQGLFTNNGRKKWPITDHENPLYPPLHMVMVNFVMIIYCFPQIDTLNEAGFVISSF